MEFNVKMKDYVKENKKHPSKEEIESFLMMFNNTRYMALDPERTLPEDKPDWYDEELLKKGQQFAYNFALSTSLAQVVGLVTLLSFKSSIKPLIYTRKSDSLKTAKNRYLATAAIVNSWYESDPWDKNSEGNKNLQKVRGYHLNVSNKVNSLTDTDIEKKCSLYKVIGHENMMCPLFDKVKNEVKGLGGEHLQRFTNRTVYFNQAEMSLTLFGFMGFVVACPEKFGIPEEEEDGLTGFVHLWRVVGYMLGVKDEYNLCKGTLTEVKDLCNKMVNILYRPNLENINEEWEHMSRCAVDGLSVETKGGSFEQILLYLFWVFNLNPDNLLKHVSWESRIGFYMYKYVVTYLYKFSLFRTLINFKIRMVFQKLKEKYKNL